MKGFLLIILREGSSYKLYSFLKEPRIFFFFMKSRNLGEFSLLKSHEIFIFFFSLRTGLFLTDIVFLLFFFVCNIFILIKKHWNRTRTIDGRKEKERKHTHLVLEANKMTLVYRKSWGQFLDTSSAEWKASLKRKRPLIHIYIYIYIERERESETDR